MRDLHEEIAEIRRANEAVEADFARRMDAAMTRYMTDPVYRAQVSTAAHRLHDELDAFSAGFLPYRLDPDAASDLSVRQALIAKVIYDMHLEQGLRPSLEI